MAERQSTLGGDVAISQTQVENLASDIDFNAGFKAFPVKSVLEEEQDIIDLTPRRPGIYVIKCETFDGTESKFEDHWVDLTDNEKHYKRIHDEFGRPAGTVLTADVPSWAWAAYHSDAVGYVGSSHSIQTRLLDHWWGEVLFTRLFPPSEIHSYHVLEGFSEDERLEVEEKVARRFEQQYSDQFVYQA